MTSYSADKLVDDDSRGLLLDYDPAMRHDARKALNITRGVEAYYVAVAARRRIAEILNYRASLPYVAFKDPHNRWSIDRRADSRPVAMNLEANQVAAVLHALCDVEEQASDE